MRVGWIFSLGALLAATAAAQTTSAPATAGSAPAATQAARGKSGELMLFEDMPVVVSGAAKHEQRPQQAAASVTVVTADEIELYGYRSLADLLRTQRSFFLHNDGLYSFLGVRGFLRPGEWNARILVLVDGRPTREPIFGQTNIDLDTVVPMELIKRVEIIRGPGSALYGSNAVFAVINVITKDGADIKNWAELKAQGGTKDTARGIATVGRKLDNGLDFLAACSRFTSQGDEDIRYPGVRDAERNRGHIEGHDFEGVGAAFLKARYGEFMVEQDYNKRDKDNRAATYLTSWTQPGRMEERRDSTSVSWDHKIDAERSLHALAFYSQYRYDQWFVYPDSPSSTYWSTARSDWFGQDVHYDWLTSSKNRLVVGSEAMQTVRTNQQDYDSLEGNFLNTDRSLNWWALYAQDEYQLTEKVALIGGLRMDKIQRFDPLFNPRAGVVYTPTLQDTFKFLYGRAFRAPNLYEMFYTVEGTNRGNPDLKPEINDTFEVVWGHDYKEGWHTEADYYLWRMSDSLSDTVNEAGEIVTRNNGISWAHGIEGELTKKWANGARVRMSASLGKAVDARNDRLEHSPEVVAALAGIVPVWNKRTFLAMENQVVGPQLSDTGSASDATFLTNLILTSRNVWKGLDVQVGVYNIFGEFGRMPHNSSSDHSQPWLRFEGTTAMVSFVYRF